MRIQFNPSSPGFVQHPLFPSSPEFAKRHPPPSSPGFAKQIIRGSTKQKDPSTALAYARFAQDDNGCLGALHVLGGSENPLCSPKTSVISVVAPPPSKFQGNKMSNSNSRFISKGCCLFFPSESFSLHFLNFAYNVTANSPETRKNLHV